MQISKHIIIVFLLITLCGCAPMTVEYYKASAPNGKLVGPSSPQRLIGPRTGIEFEDDGLTMLVQAGGDSIVLIISVPDGESATFLSDELELRTNINSEPIKLKLSKLTYNHYRNIDTKPKYEKINIKPTDTMIGKVYKLSWALKQPRLHSTSAAMQGSLPEQFYVKLPSIMFGVKEIKYPEIKFEKTKGVGVYSVN
jgi:hypothetical protein